MKIGVYSGSFNPVHVGHVALAEYLLSHTDLDEIWMVLSPRNPLKQNVDMLSDKIRYHILELALNDKKNIVPCDVELQMPKPSYTVETLRYLSEKYPEKDFSLIIGADNLEIFDRWREYQYILDHFRLIVYPRNGYEMNVEKYKGRIEVVDAPLYDVSSTMVRKRIKEGEAVDDLLSPKVLKYIKDNNLYKKAKKDDSGAKS